ncbi:MAG TPA: hypothetical protein VGB00_17790 [Pyrinomonadaceae bacterium]
MKRQPAIIAILALFIFAPGANVARAQFGDLIKKAEKKIDKTTKKVNTGTNVNANGNNQNSTQTGGEGLRWDLALKNPNFVGSVNENAMKRMIAGGMPDYGNGGLLVFSKQPFGKTSANLDDTTLMFKSSDSIYLTAFLGAPLDISFGNALTLDALIVSVGDVKTANGDYIRDTINTVYRMDKGGAKTIALDFLPAGGKSAKYQKQVGDIAASLRKLPAGIHIVQLRLYGFGGLGVGAFYYDNSAGAGGTGGALDATLKSVTMPAAVKRDAALEKSITDLLNEMGGGRALRVVIVDRDWTPQRHEVTGVLIGRAIGVVVGVKSDDGRCFRENQTYFQDYNGRAYTGLRLSGTREQTDMACENLTK